jgi:taurine dioxygenase
MSTMSAEKASPILKTRDLNPIIGAEVEGLDVSKPLSPGVAQALRDIWHEKGVLLLRGQNLNEDEQVRFAEAFGPLSRSEFIKPHHSKTNNAVMFISNIREDGKLIGAHPDGEMHFHTDQCHQEKPCSATMLYGMEIPSKGGNTLFVNAYYAYETLPQDVKDRIANMRALNAYGYGETRGAFARGDVSAAVHPVVRTHPVTGKRALYVNRLMTASIEGMTPEDSEELLTYLFDHQEREEFIYAHVWKVGDIVLWDNRCVLHARSDFGPEERRLLRRVTMLGEKPVGI